MARGPQRRGAKCSCIGCIGLRSALTCGLNYIGKARQNLRTRINERKFDQRPEVCKHLLANPTDRFNFKQPEILGNIAGQNKFLLLASLLIQEHKQHPLLSLIAILIHNGLCYAIQHECLQTTLNFSVLLLYLINVPPSRSSRESSTLVPSQSSTHYSLRSKWASDKGGRP